ncbi:alcohol acetyltransferase-domain-containing protein [Mycena galericulata]|nr:alcohol acetyltransferase-domain-containing protein [Mycena galericulata]
METRSTMSLALTHSARDQAGKIIGAFDSYHITDENSEMYLLGMKYRGSTLTKHILYPALRKVIIQHPVLGGYFLPARGERHTFHRIPVLNLDALVEFRGADEWSAQELLAEQPLFHLQRRVPLWRLLVMSDNTVFLVWHHTLCDGISCSIFHLTLLAALRSALPADSSPFAPSSDRPLPAPLEKRMLFLPSVTQLFSDAFWASLPLRYTPLGSAWTGNPVPKLPYTSPSHNRQLHFTSAEAAAIRGACRSQKTSLTAVIFTICIAVLNELISKYHPNEYTTVPVFIPVNLRALANVEPNAIGNFVSGFTEYYPLRAFSWTSARRFTSTLKSEAAMRAITYAANPLLERRLFGSSLSSGDTRAGKRACGLVLTNPGKWQDMGRGSASAWRQEEMKCAVSRGINRTALTMGFLSMPDESLDVLVGWCEGAVENAFVLEFLEGFKVMFHMLANASGGPQCVAANL